MLDNKSKAEDYTDLEIEYDEDTGFPVAESFNVDDLAATQDVISAANHLESMESTPGWAILMGYLGEEINSQLAILRMARGDQVVRTQCLLEALELLPKIVEGLKKSAISASQVLAQYTMTASQE